MREIYSNELMHFGRKGMHWGDRNGPPYPLGSDQLSRTEKRYAKARDLQDQADEYYSTHHNIKGRVTQRKADKLMKKVNKTDSRWADRQKFDLHNRKYRDSDALKQLKVFESELKKASLNKDGSVSKEAINKYNQRLADLMNETISAVAPSGRVVKWVAQRGSIGIYTGFADKGYDMSQVRNGVWDSGRIAYRKDSINKN